MDKKRKAEKNLELSTPKKKSHPSNFHLIYDKQAVVQLERLSDSVIAEMTAGSSALPPDQVNESNDDALGIDSLPNEIFLKIFGYFTQNQLGQLAQVCRSWNMLTKSGPLWKKVNVRLFPTKESKITTLKFFISRLPSCATCITLDFVTIGHEDWTSMDFKKLCVELQQKVPHLEELYLNNSLSSDTLSSIIDLCAEILPNLKKLGFRNCLFPDFSEREELSGTSKIEVLDLSLCNFCRSNKPQLSRMSSLKILHLPQTYLDDSCFENDTSFLKQLDVLDLGGTSITFRTMDVIKEYGYSLKDLYLCSTRLEDHDLTINESVFPSLKTICLYCPFLTCEGVVSFIRSCPSLENVYVDGRVAKTFAAHPFVVANRCKAGIVKVIGFGHVHVENFERPFASEQRTHVIH